jgi:hypothetical protein
MTLAEASSACTGGGYEWKGAGAAGECSGFPVEVGYAGRTQLVLKTDVVVAVRLVIENEAGEEAVGHTQLKEALKEKYGTAAEDHAYLGKECRNALLSCLEEGRVAPKTSWHWPDGTELRLSLIPFDGRVVSLLVYEHTRLAKDGESVGAGL